MKDPYYLRNEYGKLKLDDANLPIHPVELFETWLTEAFDADLPEPTAMTLATSNSDGRISSRIILNIQHAPPLHPAAYILCTISSVISNILS